MPKTKPSHSPAALPYTAAPTTMGSATSDTETGPNRMKLPSSCKMTISAVKRQTRQTPGLFLRVCVHIQFLLLLLL